MIDPSGCLTANTLPLLYFPPPPPAPPINPDAEYRFDGTKSIVLALIAPQDQLARAMEREKEAREEKVVLSLQNVSPSVRPGFGVEEVAGVEGSGGDDEEEERAVVVGGDGEEVGRVVWIEVLVGLLSAFGFAGSTMPAFLLVRPLPSRNGETCRRSGPS